MDNGKSSFSSFLQPLDKSIPISQSMDNIIEESLDVKMPVKEFSTDRNEGDRLNFYPFEDFIQ